MKRRTWPILAILLLVMGCDVVMARTGAVWAKDGMTVLTANSETATNLVTEQMAGSTDLVVMEDISAQRLLGSTEWLQNSDLNLLDFNATAETIVMAGQATCLNDAVAIPTATNLSSKSTEQGAVAINAANHNFSSDGTLANLVGYDYVVIKCMMAADSWSHCVQAAIGA